MIRTFLSLALIILWGSINAQQLSLFTQYRENSGIINPAALHTDFFEFENNMSFGTSYRVQWRGFPGAPKTQTARFSMFGTGHSTVHLLTGGYLINDQTGPTGFTGLYGKLGGLFSDDPAYGGISVALSVGIVQYRINSSDILLRDQGDILGHEDEKKWFPDAGIGVFAYKLIQKRRRDGDYLYGGVSIPQIIGLDLTFKNARGEFYTKRIQHFYGILGYMKNFGDGNMLEPSVWIKYVKNTPVSVDLNLRYKMKNNLWIGMGSSTSGNFHVETGFIAGDNIGFDNTLKIGYGFDYSFSSFGPTTGSTHELNITYSLSK